MRLRSVEWDGISSESWRATPSGQALLAPLAMPHSEAGCWEEGLQAPGSGIWQQQGPVVPSHPL